jgi:hypothetical protein
MPKAQFLQAGKHHASKVAVRSAGILHMGGDTQRIEKP